MLTLIDQFEWYWFVMVLLSTIMSLFYVFRLDKRLTIPGRTATLHRRRTIRRTILVFMISTTFILAIYTLFILAPLVNVISLNDMRM
jgi:hypothetical protein